MNAYYFSHDSNARNDPKILAMRSVYGYNGYGMYWALIEMMREQEGYKLSMQGQYVWNALALQLQCDADAVQKFVQSCINDFKLFQSDGNFFWANSLIKRMEKVQEKSEKARKSAQKRWEMQKQCESNANADQSQCNKKKRKEKKINNKTSSAEADDDVANITTGSLIGELGDEYRQIVPAEKHSKGDYAFIGSLYNDHGYDVVADGLNRLRYRYSAGEELDKPLIYLKGICEKSSGNKRDGPLINQKATKEKKLPCVSQVRPRT